MKWWRYVWLGFGEISPKPVDRIQPIVDCMRAMERRWQLTMEMENERALLEGRPIPYGPDNPWWKSGFDEENKP